MVPPLHIKKQDSFFRRDPLDSKKDTGTSTASLATVPAAAVGAIVRKRGTQLTPTQARRPPGHHRHSVVANAAVSAALFWALVQWFDPTTTGISTTGTTLDPASLSSQSANGGLTNDNAQNGQERILSLLHEAGIKDLDKDQVRKLPTWDQVRVSEQLLLCGIPPNRLKSTRFCLSHMMPSRSVYIHRLSLSTAMTWSWSDRKTVPRIVRVYRNANVAWPSRGSSIPAPIYSIRTCNTMCT
jgi:hypothetical protein